MTVKITSNMGAIWNYIPEKIEHLIVTGTDAGEAVVEIPEIDISTTIKKSPEKFNLSVDGCSSRRQTLQTLRFIGQAKERRNVAGRKRQLFRSQ